jgi:peptidoglycan L-alanyl-D-glutamate endopeptidase CwlK
MHPLLRKELSDIYQEIRERRVSIRITDTLRTFQQQNALYEIGRSKPGQRVTNARAGQSYHNYGLAVDFALLLKGGKEVSWDRNLDLNKNNLKDWDEVVAVFKHYGWNWGGNWTNFKDYPHFEKTFGYSTSELFNFHKVGKLKNGYIEFDAIEKINYIKKD